ncbi:hypothetical protein CFRA_09360 [Corynebacterium frankenforstense DSM 45800]|uniref:Uncharacterized protein n=1 Tax=Corynebacterium frankenforstense DSM 45800 TaxID=1437875 RepID=A0A1L7CU84_9CORY|nr:hypothetical protein [Corynebacterium frankenforstense]APT89424.1 hypothetical protein CFRA_09360 [Corynebacterium frankenforstense DSM 45800]
MTGANGGWTEEFLEISDGASGLQALVSRAVGLDAAALARLQQRGEFVEVFVTTPFDVVASRRVRGTASRDGAVVSARRLLDELVVYNSAEPSSRHLALGSPRDPSWPGALPPAQGFKEIDRVPVDVVRTLADKGQSLARQFSGPLGPPRSLLDQTVLEVSSAAADGRGASTATGTSGTSGAAGTSAAGGADAGTGTGANDAASDGAASDAAVEKVEIPMRMIFTCTSLGLIPGFAAATEIPRHLRVAKLGRWVRVDAPFGTVYRSTRLSLF